MTSIRQTINALIPSRPDRKLMAENERLRKILKPCVTLIVNTWPSNWDGIGILQRDDGVTAQDEREGLAGYVQPDCDIHNLFGKARDALAEADEALKEPT